MSLTVYNGRLTGYLDNRYCMTDQFRYKITACVVPHLYQVQVAAIRGIQLVRHKSWQIGSLSENLHYTHHCMFSMGAFKERPIGLYLHNE